VKILNITNEYMYVYEDGNVVKKSLNKEKGVITSYLLPKDIFSLTKKFQNTLSFEEIVMEMEQYIYSYPNINMQKEYQILYQFIERENNLIVEALLIDTEKLEKLFKTILDKFKYIDYISPAFLGWGEYYNITKTEFKNDIFIYFSEDDAFLSAFSEGKYLFHKSLNKFSELAETIGIDNDELKEILIEKGFDRSKYEDDEIFVKIESFFSEFFLKVFNLLNFSLNEYQISKFERIFFYSPFKINKLFEQYESYWELNNISFKPTLINTEYNHLEYLITLYNAKNYENEDSNFSIFQKPPPFLTTPAGKFFLFSGVVFILFLSWIGYEYYTISKINQNIEILNHKVFKMKERSLKYAKLVRILRKRVNKINKEIDKINNHIKELNSKIEILYNENKKPIFYNVLIRIDKYLKKYNLKITKLQKNKNFYILIIKSNYNNTSDIAKFMQDLINIGFKNVYSKTINNTNKEYISYVEFKL